MDEKAIIVGIENFERIIKDGHYYVDKSLLIEEMLENQTPVTFFTRPRRFGKILNMLMSKYFFDVENKNKGHKMSEDFNKMREEIEIIDKLLVRPEGWNK